MTKAEITKILLDHNLKVTPQRMTILEIILDMDSHPSADQILELMRFYHPNISLATVYNSLKTFSDKGIIKKILTSDDKTRFDPVHKKHHHIYYLDSDKIEDFEDKELDKILKEYFRKKKIAGFKIDDITLQLTGKSISTASTENKPVKAM